MPISIPQNTSILISRTDGIGDVILTIPISSYLKKLYPNNKIVFLATTYTQPILKYIASIDEIIDYNSILNLPFHQQKEIFQSHNIHTAIVVFPTYEVTKFLYQHKIPYRIATAHRWYNWIFCNRWVAFSRKNSPLHEAQLNFYLLKPLGISYIPSLSELPSMFSLKSIPPLRQSIKALLDDHKFKLILHPKSKGSAREWSIDNYIRLINNLDASQFQIIITGTSNEAPALERIFSECPHVINMVGKTALDDLISLINECDALVAGSTGTLHIAAMLGKHAMGLFPPIKPMHAGRWAPIGKNAKVFAIHKNCMDCKNNSHYCSCIQQITPDEIAKYLDSVFQNHNS